MLVLRLRASRVTLFRSVITPWVTVFCTLASGAMDVALVRIFEVGWAVRCVRVRLLCAMALFGFEFWIFRRLIFRLCVSCSMSGDVICLGEIVVVEILGLVDGPVVMVLLMLLDTTSLFGFAFAMDVRLIFSLSV